MQIANPEERGFLWPKTPRRELDYSKFKDARRIGHSDKLGEKYWVFDGAAQAYPALVQKIIDAGHQAEKDAKDSPIKCKIVVSVNCLSYRDFGPYTLDFHDVTTPQNANLCGYLNTYDSSLEKWSKGKFSQKAK